jgi:hypothetical protein
MKYVFILLLSIGYLAHGQVLPDTVFYNEQWEPATRSDYTYFRRIEKKKELYIVHDYYHSGVMQMSAVCTALDPDIKNGLCTYYYPSGHRKSEGDWYNDKKYGTFRFYDDESERLTSSIEYKNDKKNGKSIINYQNGDRQISVYDNDRLIRSYTEGLEWEKKQAVAKTIKAPESDELPFSAVLRKNFDRWPDSLQKISGVMVIKFMIDENGNPVNIKAASYGHKKHALLISTSIAGVSKWESYTVSGKAVRTNCTVSVSFPDLVAHIIKRRVTDSIISTNYTFINGEVHRDTTVIYTDGSDNPAGSGIFGFDDWFGGENPFDKAIDKSVDKSSSFEALLTKALHADTSHLSKLTDEVEVKFNLDPTGDAGKITVTKGKNQKLIDLIVKAVKDVPRWHSMKDRTLTRYTIAVEFPSLRLSQGIVMEQSGSTSSSFTENSISYLRDAKPELQPIKKTEPAMISMTPMETDSISADFKSFLEGLYIHSGLSERGSVMLKFIVSKEGKVGEITMIDNENKILGSFVTDAIHRYAKWVPDTVTGHMVDTEYRLMVGFPSMNVFSLSWSPAIK